MSQIRSTLEPDESFEGDDASELLRELEEAEREAARTGEAVVSPDVQPPRPLPRGGSRPLTEAELETEEAPQSPWVPSTQPETDLRLRARTTLDSAIDALLDQQHPDGYWCAELEGDSILQSEYILLKWIIEQEDDPRLPWIANYLRAQQRPDGTWGQYPGSGPDLSATVKGYFALKLMGDSPDAPHMKKAREKVIALGGAERCNSFTKFYFACLGQISFSACPSIPPEIMFLPRWFYFSLAHVSAWTRTMILPLSIVVTKHPLRKLTFEQGIDELYIDEKARHKLTPMNNTSRFWTKFFLIADRVLKLIDKIGTPLRKAALNKMVRWMIEHTEGSDGLGAIFPPMVYILIALRTMGFEDDHPVIKKAHKDLDDLMIIDEHKKQIRIQPCFSPIWDTGIAAYALTEAGLDSHHRVMRKCADWLVSKECRKPADWMDNVRKKVAPSGWYFEFNNPFYPDVDDTVMVAMALKKIGDPAGVEAAERSIDWVLAMQNDDGGWAAFDRTKDRKLLEHVPFADHNAIQDPSCPDITGRTLECLGHHGLRIGHPAVDKAIKFIHSKQEKEGCWFGRWGVNYIYGTWQVVCGLKNVGYDMQQPWVQQAGAWLKSVQQTDGSFGESANSYEDASLKGQGPSTASQTAWAAMAMMSIYGPHDPAVKDAIAWLCDTQLQEDHPETEDKAGSWHEQWFTGTGFPCVFYLRYHLYRLYFPVMAIGRWLHAK